MKKDIIFTLPAEALEGATEVVILGDFNNWSPSDEYKLEKQQDGSFKTTVPLEEGRTYQYRFLLDNGRWVNDYHAQQYVPVYEFFVDNCVITVPETTDEPSKENAPATSKQETGSEQKEKATKEKAGATTATSGSKSKKSSTSKAAKAKTDTEKVKAKKAEKTEKPAKTAKTSKK